MRIRAVLHMALTIFLAVQLLFLGLLCLSLRGQLRETADSYHATAVELEWYRQQYNQQLYFNYNDQ